MKINDAAKQAKKDGYTHVYSVVKSVYNTVYVHVNSVDSVIRNGWIPCPKGHYGNWHGRIGITFNQMLNSTKKSINKSDMIKKYKVK